MRKGRPTKYKPEYCDTIVDFMRDGASIVEFAASIGVSRDSVYEWAKNNPAFSDALKTAMELCEAWWTAQGRVHMMVKEFNHVLWYMQMKNRFGWRDKQETELTGPGGSPLSIEVHFVKAQD